jgi:hypothetical protein
MRKGYEGIVISLWMLATAFILVGLIKLLF